MNLPALVSIGTDDATESAYPRGGRTRARCRLALMVLISLLGHAATFYVFQVAYTPSGSLLPPPARVVLVPLDRPENASIARWLSLLDPALTVQPQLPTAGEVPDGLDQPYVPSYKATLPDFKPLDALDQAEVLSAPPQPLVPGPVPMNDTPSDQTVPPPDATAVTAPGPARVVLGGSIRELVVTPLPPVPVMGAVGTKTTEPTVVLVGVRADGGEPFLFPVRQAPVNSVGANADEAIELARGYLAHLAFRPRGATDNGGEVLWGRATFYWGDDTRPKKQP